MPATGPDCVSIRQGHKAFGSATQARRPAHMNRHWPAYTDQSVKPYTFFTVPTYLVAGLTVTGLFQFSILFFSRQFLIDKVPIYPHPHNLLPLTAHNR